MRKQTTTPKQTTTLKQTTTPKQTTTLKQATTPKQTTTLKQATMLKQATEILDKIMQTANWFLTSANRFTIEKLQNNDPTLEEIARIMESLAGIVYLVRR